MDLAKEFEREFGATPTPRNRATHVRDTEELRRIRDAPRELWHERPDLDRLIAALTLRLRTGVPIPDHIPERQVPRRLLGTQASALRALYESGGCFAPIDTGGGKTLLSLVAAELMQAKRAVLIAPKELEGEHMTHRKRCAPYWKILPLKFVSYQVLPHQPDLLERLNPDLVILDEAHFVKSTGSARWERIRAWRRKNPSVPVMAMSGSFAERSGLTFAHIARLCLGGASFLPRERDELIEWCQALDVSPPFGTRLDTGALQTLDSIPAEQDADLIDTARAKFARRMLSTRGVVGSAGDLPAVKLMLREHHMPAPEAVQSCIDKMRQDGQVPNGDTIESAFDLWRHERSMSCGLWYRWRDPAPPEWLAARKAISAYYRAVLEHSQKLRCPMDVANHLDRHGEVPGHPGGAELLAEWREIAPTFKPITVHEWIDTSTLEFAKDWMSRTGGLCWVWHAGFGERLTRESGVPYFREGAMDATGRRPEQCEGPLILSMHSCRRGLNLQAWQQNLIIGPPTTNEYWQQLLSRTHRRGQENDVTCDIVLRVEGDVLGYSQAHIDAQYSASIKAHPQRLMVAERIEVRT